MIPKLLIFITVAIVAILGILAGAGHIIGPDHGDDDDGFKATDASEIAASFSASYDGFFGEDFYLADNSTKYEAGDYYPNGTTGAYGSDINYVTFYLMNNQNSAKDKFDTNKAYYESQMDKMVMGSKVVGTYQKAKLDGAVGYFNNFNTGTPSTYLYYTGYYGNVFFEGYFFLKGTQTTDYEVYVLASEIYKAINNPVSVDKAKKYVEPDNSSYKDGPITISTYVNYNGDTATLTFEKPPERVVAGCVTALNMLLYNGLGDKIVGIYYMEEDVWDEVADEYAKVKARIGEDHILTGNIQASVLTDWEPDLVIAWVAWTENKLGTPEYWKSLGCNVMSLDTMCAPEPTMDDIVRDWNNMGDIFDVRETTDLWLNQFTSKIQTLKGILGDDGLTYAVIDGTLKDTGAWAYGKGEFICVMFDEFGAINAFDTSKPQLSEIYDVCENIDVMFFVCYGKVNYEDSLKSWQDNDVVALTCPAIKNGNTKAITLSVAYGASPQMLEMLDYLVETLGGTKPVESSYDNGPITISTYVNYNGDTATLTFEKPPERVVAGCVTALNMLLYNGLGDKIVGIYYMEEDVWDEVADEYAKVKARIGEDHILTGNIQASVLTDWEPDLVIAWVAWTENKLGTPEYWKSLGCNVMSLDTMCAPEPTMDDIKRDWNNMGDIFDVRDSTDKWLGQFIGKIQTLKGILGDDGLTYAVIDGTLKDTGAWAYGKGEFICVMFDEFGAVNAFETSKPQLSEIYDVCEDIDVMFFVCYGRVNYEDSLKSWQDNDVVALTCPAIKNGNTKAITLSVAYGASPQMLEMLDYLVETLSA